MISPFMRSATARAILLFSLMFGAVALPSACATDAKIDADWVITRHIEARGGETALRNIRSVVFSKGLYQEGDFSTDGKASMMLMRPYYKLVGLVDPEDNPGFLEGYDGAAWEWFKDPGLVVRTVGAASAASRHHAEVDGPFLDYAVKGHKIELIGEALIAGKPAYQIRLTMMDGFVSDTFFDQQTFLTVAERKAAPVHAFGAAVASENRVGDHREIAGVMFPHRYVETNIATGEEMSSMQWGVIDANVDIPVEWFSPPQFERSRIQTFMEQLYFQRSDAQAMLWTYQRFRMAYPDEDTRVASEVIGYQALKMGDIDPAVALLERNAADNPDAADSAFGLGRAYATAERSEDATNEFERALRLEPGHKRATRALAELGE